MHDCYDILTTGMLESYKQYSIMFPPDFLDDSIDLLSVGTL